MTASPTHAEVAEAIRAVMAAYTQALDDGRTEDLVATFCPDGACDIPGLGTHVGHDALRRAYSGWEPPVPMRHVVANVLVTEWDAHEARATSDVVVLAKGDAGWSVAVVGRYEDTLHHEQGAWRFHRRAAEFVR